MIIAQYLDWSFFKDGDNDLEAGTECTDTTVTDNTERWEAEEETENLEQSVKVRHPVLYGSIAISAFFIDPKQNNNSNNNNKNKQTKKKNKTSELLDVYRKHPLCVFIQDKITSELLDIYRKKSLCRLKPLSVSSLWASTKSDIV